MKRSIKSGDLKVKTTVGLFKEGLSIVKVNCVFFFSFAESGNKKSISCGSNGRRRRDIKVRRSAIQNVNERL